MTQCYFGRLVAVFSLIAICSFPARAQPSQMRMRQGRGNVDPVSEVAGSDEILANDNRTPAGQLEQHVLNVPLEIRTGVWHAEAVDGPPLYVQAFGEKGKPAQIPGPLLRVPTGTTVHVTITNTLNAPATVYGFLTRPASSDPEWRSRPARRGS